MSVERDENSVKIKAPVSIYDLQVAFGQAGTGSTDLGTIMNTIVNLPYFNMWAKWKPIRIQDKFVGILSMATLNGFVNSGKAYPCGIIKNGVSGTIPFYDNNGVLLHYTWTYDKPYQNSDTYKAWRLTDFANCDNPTQTQAPYWGYWSAAMCPMKVNFPDSNVFTLPQTSSGKTGIKLGFMLSFHTGVSSFWNENYCISMNNLYGQTTGSFGYFPTIAIWKVDTSYTSGIKVLGNPYVKSSTTTFMTDVTQTNIPASFVLLDLDHFYSKMVSQWSNIYTTSLNFVAVMYLDGTQRIGTDGEGYVLALGNSNLSRLEYEAGADRKVFTTQKDAVLEKLGRITLEATFTKRGTGTYYLSSARLSVVKNTYDYPSSQNPSIYYRLWGVGGTGVMKNTDGTQVATNEVTFDSNSLSLTSSTTNKEWTYNERSNPYWDFTSSTASQKMAVVCVDIKAAQNASTSLGISVAVQVNDGSTWKQSASGTYYIN